MHHQTNNKVSLKRKNKMQKFFNANTQTSIKMLKKYLEEGKTERGILLQGFSLHSKTQRLCFCLSCAKEQTAKNKDAVRGLELLLNDLDYNQLVYCQDCKKPLFDTQKPADIRHANNNDLLIYNQPLNQ